MRTHWMLAAMLSMIGLIGASTLAAPRSRGTPATQPASGKGSVSGVVTKDGKPLANVTVRLMLPRPAGANGQKPDGNSAGDGKKGKKGGGASGDAKRTPIAETTTDDEGKFTLADVPSGSYVVVANLKEEGVGRARVTVSDGQTADVSLDVQPRKSEGGGGKKNRK